MNNQVEFIPVFRPTLPSYEEFCSTLKPSYESGIVTVGKIVESFEAKAAEYTGARYAVAVSNCTSGLILAFSALELPLGTEVILPSFTFAATVQALFWNNLKPVYVDCLPNTFTIDPEQVENAIGPETSAIYAVNIFGLPPDVDELTAISTRHGVPLVFDSAQGLGSLYKDRPSGSFGQCEIFSLSPTKVITAIEGGLITTNNDDLAAKLRSMRDYGKGPDGQEMIYNGLSARMSEFHASIGLLSLRNAENLIASRMRLINAYRDKLGTLPGCSVQEWPNDRTSSGNYFTLLIGPKAKADRETVYKELLRSQIQSKKYFYPPVHVQSAFRDRPHRIVGELPNTWAASRTSLALPLFAHMTDEQHDRVCSVVERVLGY
ncbi:MAG: DegT/DnrJ/EryC1/StrS family aminotransferase [Desulfomonilaceae bacterium]|jgi:dTDP-4-amino-4,6-dideoxygalactose transaminase